MGREWRVRRNTRTLYSLLRTSETIRNGRVVAAQLACVAADGCAVECAGLLPDIAADAKVAVLARPATLRVAFLFTRGAAEAGLRIRAAIPEQVPRTALVPRRATHDGAIGGARHVAGNLIRFAFAAGILATAIAALLTGGAAAIATRLVRRAAGSPGGVARTIATGVSTGMIRRAAIGSGDITRAAAAIASTALLSRIATLAVAGNVAFLTANVGGCRKGSVVATAFGDAFVAAAFLIRIGATVRGLPIAIVATKLVVVGIATEWINPNAAVNAE